VRDACAVKWRASRASGTRLPSPLSRVRCFSVIQMTSCVRERCARSYLCAHKWRGKRTGSDDCYVAVEQMCSLAGLLLRPSWQARGPRTPDAVKSLQDKKTWSLFSIVVACRGNHTHTHTHGHTHTHNQRALATTFRDIPATTKSSHKRLQMF
jgi:hypothetical protein